MSEIFGSGKGRGGKEPIPFYQLPAHMRPCSTIIKETRLQLKYSAKLGSDWEASLVGDNGGPGPGGDGRAHYSDGLSEFEQRIGAGTGAKAVHTQRPFTPRDSENLWGVSARKRPPSAITLSRLSLDDIDEGRPSSKSKQRNGGGRFHQVHGKSLDFPGADLSPTSGPRNEAELERLRTRFQALNVQLKGKKGGHSPPDPYGPHNGHLKALPRQASGTGSGTATNNLKNRSSSSLQRSISYPAQVLPISEPYQTIDSLEVAVEYLKTFAESSETIPKSELVAILKQIKTIVSRSGFPEESLKCRVIKLLFKLVESNANDEALLFWASFILLHCQIIGNRLTTVFKMVFKACRSEDYAEIIQESEYLDVFMNSLGQVCPITQTESMIYAYGTLKFICSRNESLLHAVNLNLIAVMSLHLNLLNFEIGGSKQASENIQNGVFQLTSILRSVVGLAECLGDVAKSGLLDEVCNSLAWTLHDIDVLTNVVRILSVVSGHDACLQMLCQNQNLSVAFVQILKFWHTNDDIAVRLTYCMGNLLANDEEMRVKMYHEPLCFEMIIKLIVHHLNNWRDASEDILVKSIRIMANWSLNQSIGAIISEDSQLSEILNCILSGENVSSELLLCAISTLNNISYYKVESDSLEEANVKTADCLYGYLNLKNVDTRTETMKVLGNLTRNETIRASAAEHIGAILISLEEDDPDLLSATVGVLMNTIVDDRAREEFVRKGGLQFLINLMQRWPETGLSIMMYQFLWNLIFSGMQIGPDGRERCGILSRAQIQDFTTIVSTKVGQVRSELELEPDEDMVSLYQDFLVVGSRLERKLLELQQ